MHSLLIHHMSKHSVPKSDGETLLRHQVARARSRIAKMEKDGKEYESPIVSIPINSAIEITERAKIRKEQVTTLVDLIGEMSFQLDFEYVVWSPAKLRALAARATILASKIK